MFDFGAFYPIDLQYPTDSWEKFTCLPIDYCSTNEQKLLISILNTSVISITGLLDET